MFNNKKSIYTFKLLGDLVLLNIIFICSAIVAQSLEIFLSKDFIYVIIPLLNLLWFVSSKGSLLYKENFDESYSKHIFILLKNVFVQIIFTILFLFFIKENLFTRNFIVYYGTGLSIILLIKDFIDSKLFKFIRNKYREQLLFIGKNETSINLGNIFTEEKQLGYDIAGFVDIDEMDLSQPQNISFIEKTINKKNVSSIVIALKLNESDKIDELLKLCDRLAIKAFIIPDYFKFVSNKFSLNFIGEIPIINVRNNPLEELQWRFVKRIFDITFTLTLFLTILWWLFPLIGIIIKISSKGSIFFIQERVGKNNKIFNCYKFRTMTTSASSEKNSDKPVRENDNRVTKIGSILRKTNLDEFPQFINVLKGDMSIVGPRPHAIPFNNNYGEIVEEIKLRHRIKPGITGWAQVHGLRGDVFDFEENKKRTQKRIDYDIWYIENWGFKFDIQIIFETILQVVRNQNKGI